MRGFIRGSIVHNDQYVIMVIIDGGIIRSDGAQCVVEVVETRKNYCDGLFFGVQTENGVAAVGFLPTCAQENTPPPDEDFQF